MEMFWLLFGVDKVLLGGYNFLAKLEDGLLDPSETLLSSLSYNIGIYI